MYALEDNFRKLRDQIRIDQQFQIQKNPGHKSIKLEKLQILKSPKFYKLILI
jgi:hypothetical protein